MKMPRFPGLDFFAPVPGEAPAAPSTYRERAERYLDAVLDRDVQGSAAWGSTMLPHPVGCQAIQQELPVARQVLAATWDHLRGRRQNYKVRLESIERNYVNHCDEPLEDTYIDNAGRLRRG